jgi:hypothetical protein
MPQQNFLNLFDDLNDIFIVELVVLADLKRAKRERERREM